MSKQDYSVVGGDTKQRFRDVGGPAENVVHTRQPEARTIVLNRLGLILKHSNALGLHGARNFLGVGIAVMISQYRPQPVRSAHLADDLAQGFGGKMRLWMRLLPGVRNKNHRSKAIRSGCRAFTQRKPLHATDEPKKYGS